jgi:regulator of sigma E protease
MFIVDIIVFILVLGVIILIHEAGHFYFAKKAGILCHEFAIGMGPALYQKRKGETIYSIRSIPIGGFVSMAGESISDALIRQEQVIGIRLNGQGQVTDIILSDQIHSDLKGIVKSYDLYGKNFNPLFLTLDINGQMIEYPVTRDAIYRLSEKKEMWITPAEKSFESKTLIQRFLVIFGGPMMNFILALFLFFIVGFFLTKPNLEDNTVASVGTNSPAELLGLQPGDKITMINGQVIDAWSDISTVMADLNSTIVTVTYERNGVLETESTIPTVIMQTIGLSNVNVNGIRESDDPIIGQAFGRASSDGQLQSGDVISMVRFNETSHPIGSWQDLIDLFSSIDATGTITVFYQRDGVAGNATYEIISKRALEKLGYQDIIFQIGVTPTSSFDLGYTLSYPFTAFYSNTSQVFQTIGLLFDRGENLGLGDLSGPVGIFTLVSSTTSQGLIAILGFTAFLSINIGLLNLMPIPALDGGRLVFLGIEAITRRPLNRKLENTINNVMFFLLLGLFVFVTYNDIFRLIRG